MYSKNCFSCFDKMRRMSRFFQDESWSIPRRSISIYRYSFKDWSATGLGSSAHWSLTNTVLTAVDARALDTFVRWFNSNPPLLPFQIFSIQNVLVDGMICYRFRTVWTFAIVEGEKRSSEKTMETTVERYKISGNSLKSLTETILSMSETWGRGEGHLSLDKFPPIRPLTGPSVLKILQIVSHVQVPVQRWMNFLCMYTL